MKPNIQKIRGDFPILRRIINGRQLIYLDSAATTQKPNSVIEAVSSFYKYYNSNIHRSVHALAGDATEAYENARKRVAEFVNAPDSSCVVFTKNCTEAINLVAYSWARTRLKPDDEIILSVMEHHSNLVPWQEVAKETGARIRFADITSDGNLNFLSFYNLLSPQTKIISLTGLSNVLGSLVDIKKVSESAKLFSALLIVDGAQLVAHTPVDFQSLDADFLAFSGHKVLGPTGVGVLVGKRERLEEMSPFLTGGDMILDVTLDDAEWNEVPWKFEAGTPPIAGAIGLATALDYLESVGMEALLEYERELMDFALRELKEVEGLRIYGSSNERIGALAFNLEDERGRIIHPHDVGTLLDHEGIAIRVGHHCAKPLMRRFEVNSMCRASFYLYNTEEEVSALKDALMKARDFFSGKRAANVV
ncbi:MAG: cysteine desulfurase [Myxococcota bacterium]